MRFKPMLRSASVSELFLSRPCFRLIRTKIKVNKSMSQMVKLATPIFCKKISHASKKPSMSKKT